MMRLFLSNCTGKFGLEMGMKGGVVECEELVEKSGIGKNFY